MNDTKPEPKNETPPGAAPATPANDDAAPGGAPGAAAAAEAIAAAPHDGTGAEGAVDGGARIAALEAEVAAKAAELAAFKDSAQRQLAETHNQRRRADNEVAESRKYGAASFARDMLAIADNLKRALAAAAPAPGAGTDAPAGDAAARGAMLESLSQGVELIDRELSAILERHGIKRLDPKGEKFDPNFHQAMFEVPTAAAEPGTVVEVLQPGYRLHDRLLRPAMVGVAKVLPAEEPPAK